MLASWILVLVMVHHGWSWLVMVWMVLLIWFGKQHIMRWIPWFIGMGIVVVAAWFPVNNDGLIIEEARPSYVLLRFHDTYYYGQQPKARTLEKGDRLILDHTPVIKPLRRTTYEGQFDFVAYLRSRTIQEELVLSSFSFSWKQPYRPLTWRMAITQHFTEELQPWVSQLMFNEQYTHTRTILDVFSASGLGWWTTLWMVDAVLKPYTTTTQRRGLQAWLIGLSFLLMSHHFGIVRTNLFTLFSWMKRNALTRWGRRYTILGFFLIHRWSYLSLGVWLYGAYKVLYQTILPRIAKQWRWIMYAIGVYIIQALLFHTISLFQPLIFPLWVVVYPILLFYVVVSGVIPFLQRSLIHLFFAINSIFEFVDHFNVTVFLVPFTWWMVVFIVVSLWLVIVLSRYRLHKPMRLIATSLVLVVLVQQSPIHRLIHPLRIHFINVGQGDATLIEMGGKTVLIDTGGHPTFDIATHVLIPYFKRQRIRALDYVLITHDDYDHVGALPTLQHAFPVKRVVRHLPYPLVVGRLIIENLNIWQETMQEENDRSLILSVRTSSCHVLVMGDASTDIEHLLIGLRLIQHVNVLRLGHHGSLTSTSESFLDWTQPEAVIISLGGGNRYGHPHPDVMARLTYRALPTYRTDLHGTIVMESCKIRI